MDLPDLILVNLLHCAATPSAIAEHLRSTSHVVEALLNAHRRNGHTERVDHEYLQIWKLTESGKTLAQSIKASA